MATAARNVMQTNGVLYIAAGKRYVRAAVRSARSVREHCPGLGAHLFGDWADSPAFDFEHDPYPFTSVGPIEDPHRRSKLDYLPRTPFDRTLYLDSDTLVGADIQGVFDLLDRFDLAVSHAHKRNDPSRLAPWRIELPLAFPQYNGGVLLYRRTPDVIKFLEDWRDAYKAAGYSQDQRTLRELLWFSDLRMATLPPEYNVRYIKYRWIWSKEEALPQIYHLRRLQVGWFGWLSGPWVRRFKRLLARLRARGARGTSA